VGSSRRVKKSQAMNELPVIACSLTAEELPERRRRWRALPLTARTEIVGGVRLTFRAGPGVEERVRALAALERDCCGFARFEVYGGAAEVALDVTSSEDGIRAVREIFA